MEKWRPVIGYEGMYEVSNLGRIRRLPRLNIISACYHYKGYLLVTLWKNNTGKTFTVHRIVAKAFKKNKFNLPQINHKDSNKANNNIENLEWCTGSQNIQHSIKNGTFQNSLTG